MSRQKLEPEVQSIYEGGGRLFEELTLHTEKHKFNLFIRGV
jgi:hypothetical protein